MLSFSSLSEPLVRAWFTPHTPVYEELGQILNTSRLRTAISKLSGSGQTSQLEGFHSTYNHFAPKMYHFTHPNMKSRSQIAILHQNENAGRADAVDKDNRTRHSITFPKAKMGEYTLRTIKVPCTYNYAEELQKEVHDLSQGKQPVQETAPPTLSSKYVHPDKKAVESAHYSRLSQKMMFCSLSRRNVGRPCSVLQWEKLH
jgi:hypothetical protein